MTYLIKVGTQRLETTNPEDIDVDVDIYYKSEESDEEIDIILQNPLVKFSDIDSRSGSLNSSVYAIHNETDLNTSLTLTRLKRKSFFQWIRESWFEYDTKYFSLKHYIDPLTKMYNLTATLIIFCYCYNMFYVPVSIAYEYEARDGL
jgi:hypothetical protein